MRMLHTDQGSLKVLGEHPALDLLNSIDVDRGRTIDYLGCSSDLVPWADAVELLGTKSAQELARRFAERPEIAEATHAEVLTLRSMLERAITDPSHRRELAELLNRLLPTPLIALDSSTGLDVAATTPEATLLGRLAFFSAGLVIGVPHETIRRCHAPACTWFFIDRTGGRRQWCVMQTCGNAAKARRHRERLRNRA